MIKRVSYEIPEPHLFIKEFQQIYSTPPIAFKEYVSNSIDAINRTEKNYYKAKREFEKYFKLV